MATLRHVGEPRALLFAAMPLLFALHQLTEGLVWLGLEGRLNEVALHHATLLFMLYAQGVLPMLMPLAVALMEPEGWRRTAIWGLTGLGAIVSAWDLYGITFLPSQASLQGHSIAYRNPMTGDLWISGMYIAATCGALLLSSHRVVRWYGVFNVIGLTIVQIVKSYAFASVWCFYAAALSVMIYWQFNRGRIGVENLNGASPLKGSLSSVRAG